MSLSDEELCLLRLLHFSFTLRGDDEPAVKHGKSSVSSPEPSVSSSVRTLSRESEIRTATPGVAVSPNTVRLLSNNAFAVSVDWKLDSGSDVNIPPTFSQGCVSVGSHSDIIVPEYLYFNNSHRLPYNLLDFHFKDRNSKFFESCSFPLSMNPHNPSGSFCFLVSLSMRIDNNRIGQLGCLRVLLRKFGIFSFQLYPC